MNATFRMQIVRYWCFGVARWVTVGEIDKITVFGLPVFERVGDVAQYFGFYTAGQK